MGRYLANMQVGIKNEYDMYLDRLEEHVRKISNPVSKDYKVGNGIVRAIRKDKLENPNGMNKWNGWVRVGTIYRIEVLDKGQVVASIELEDKDAANRYFIEEAKPMAMRIQEEACFH